MELEPMVIEGLTDDHKKLLITHATTGFMKIEFEYALEEDEDVILWNYEWANLAAVLNKKLEKKGVRNKDGIRFLIKRITEVI